MIRSPERGEWSRVCNYLRRSAIRNPDGRSRKGRKPVKIKIAFMIRKNESWLPDIFNDFHVHVDEENNLVINMEKKSEKKHHGRFLRREFSYEKFHPSREPYGGGGGSNAGKASAPCQGSPDHPIIHFPTLGMRWTRTQIMATTV